MTEIEEALIRSRLVKAETAYEAIMTGTSVKKFVDQNGESVEYSATNILKLEEYIQSLKDQLNPCAGFRRRMRPAIGFTF